MKLAWTLHVTAGVMVSSGVTLPARASAERRGVRGPKWRGVSPTTIIARTGFKISPDVRGFSANSIAFDLLGTILAGFYGHANQLAKPINEMAPY